MQKNMLIAVGSGGVSAFASVAFLTGAPGGVLLVYVATLPLFLAALTIGPMGATVASLSGFVLAGILGGMVAAGAFAILHGFPAWLVSRQALLRGVTPGAPDAWYPLGNIAATLSMFGAGMMMLLGYYLGSGHEAGLTGLVSDHLRDVLGFMSPDIDPAIRTMITESMLPVFPGAMAASWVVTIAANGLIAQAILRRAGRNIRPHSKLGDFSLPQWAAWPLVAAAVIALAASGDVEYLARNAAVVLAVPYFIVGLVVVHSLSRRLPLRGLALFAFYMVMLISSWSLVIVAALGMLEQWADLRLRFTGPPSTDD